LAYLLVLPGSRARIVRCGGRYDPQLVKRSSEWVSVVIKTTSRFTSIQPAHIRISSNIIFLLSIVRLSWHSQFTSISSSRWNNHSCSLTNCSNNTIIVIFNDIKVIMIYASRCMAMDQTMRHICKWHQGWQSALISITSTLSHCKYMYLVGNTLSLLLSLDSQDSTTRSEKKLQALAYHPGLDNCTHCSPIILVLWILILFA